MEYFIYFFSYPFRTLFPEMVRVWFTQEIFRRSGVVTTRRPFELTIEEFASLCDVYAEVSLICNLPVKT